MKKADVGDPTLARTEFEALHAFQRIMWDKLMANAHKGGWESASPEELLGRLEDELEELKRAVRCAESPEAVARECADVANFAMMLADVVGGLPYKRRGGL